MAFAEKLRLLIFGGIVFCVYAAELVLICVFFYDKATKKHIRWIFRCKVAWVIHILAVAGVLCFLYGYFVEPYWLQINTFKIETEKLSDTSFRIVHISDLHCDKEQRNEEKIVKIINGLEADIIVFTGDSINTPAAMPRFQKTLGALKARLGKFAVRGNFDVWYWRDLPIFENTGFEVLDENVVEINKDGERFCISGLSCLYPDRCDKVLSNMQKDVFNVFLYHYPDLIDHVQGDRADLYLCGHTHGGQISLPYYGAIITLSKCGKKYESGEYHVGKTFAYVNRGIGLELLPAPQVRFGARPEIAVFDIVPKKQGETTPAKIQG
jgi:predicted MPP superfamily phosphohydrolase